jgi:hypothetical protein
MAEGWLSEFSAVGVKGYWDRTVCIAIFWFDLTYNWSAGSTTSPLPWLCWWCSVTEVTAFRTITQYTH